LMRIEVLLRQMIFVGQSPEWMIKRIWVIIHVLIAEKSLLTRLIFRGQARSKGSKGTLVIISLGVAWVFHMDQKSIYYYDFTKLWSNLLLNLRKTFAKLLAKRLNSSWIWEIPLISILS
jgi:hypothetical protein